MKVNYRSLKKASSLPPKKFDELIGEFKKISPEKLFLMADSLTFSDEEIKKIKKIEKLLAAGTPPEYIFKKAHFCKNDFYVDENVLIPRPETEILVAEAIKFLEYRIKNKEYSRKTLRIFDLGTGSGCIGIVIAQYLNSHYSVFPIQYSISASDISPAALKVAKQNAKNYKTKINFVISDLFENINGKFDLIIANLPYVDPASFDFKSLADPKIALDGGKNGFALIEKVLRELPDHLADGGLAIFEHGYNHLPAIKKLTKELGLKVKIIKDLADFNRFALISKN